jgi:hypothetical protein
VSFSSPPSRPGPADSEPAEPVPPTLPPSAADLAPWGDSDIGAPAGPVPTFSTNPPPKREGEMPTIGHIGRYALKYKIGAGGLGTVYAAHDPLLSRLIAIKTLNLEISADERDAFNALFLNEARAAGGLSHPHIVTVFDAGVSDQSAYIAMELLKGRDLRQLRQEGWRPMPMQAALIVRRVADALAYAHSKGVVHRDIKPANIFMVGRTQPRVLDFGIARIAHQHDGAGDVAAGSPYYMAPEQARQQTVDRRADVFSLGVVLYELLTDQKPFRGATLSEITTAVLEHHPPRADEVNPAVPAALAEIAARAMQKDPEHRYRSARALSRELRHWLEENASAPDSVPAGEAAAPAPQQRRRWVLAGAAAALLVVGGAWWAWTATHTAADPMPASAAAEPTPEPPPEPTPPAALAEAPAAPAPASAVEPAPVVAEAPPPPPAPAPVVAETRPPAPAPAPKAAPPRERRTREARAAVNIAAAPALGSVRVAVSPWGNVEVDGTPVGTTPPLNELTLPEGRHQITIRNADFPPFTTSVNVTPGQPVSLKHRFGS